MRNFFPINLDFPESLDIDYQWQFNLGNLIAKKNWQKYKGRPDFIFFDAWCGGAKPIPKNKWRSPLNKLEIEKDPEQIWAKWSNSELAGEYQSLFNRFDNSISLVH